VYLWCVCDGGCVVDSIVCMAVCAVRDVMCGVVLCCVVVCVV
jgi:hypothetical protein